jgi:hypothetical protein
MPVRSQGAGWVVAGGVGALKSTQGLLDARGDSTNGMEIEMCCCL